MRARATLAAVQGGAGVRAAALLAAVGLVACGCPSSGTMDVIELRDAAASGPQQMSMDGFDYLDYVLTESRPDSPVYLAAGEAPRCPRVKVATPGGEETELDFARGGATTVVLFWRPDVMGDIMALELVGGVVESHKGLGVRGFSVLRAAEADETGLRIARRGSAGMGLYVDASGDAQRALAKAAGAGDATSLPAVCMIDRAGRVRHYRPKVSCALQTARGDGQRTAGFIEMGPPGQSVEASLERLLDGG